MVYRIKNGKLTLLKDNNKVSVDSLKIFDIFKYSELKNIINEFNENFPNDFCLEGVIAQVDQDEPILYCIDCFTKWEYEHDDCLLSYKERLEDIDNLVKDNFLYIKNFKTLIKDKRLFLMFATI